MVVGEKDMEWGEAKMVIGGKHMEWEEQSKIASCKKQDTLMGAGVVQCIAVMDFFHKSCTVQCIAVDDGAHETAPLQSRRVPSSATSHHPPRPIPSFQSRPHCSPFPYPILCPCYLTSWDTVNDTTPPFSCISRLMAALSL